MDSATNLSSMEYGGITPLGLPSNWPILVDTQVIQAGSVIIGSGLRNSKILISTTIFKTISNISILDIAK